MSVEHSDIVLGERHGPPNWEPADATARLALTPSASDVGKWALQLDDRSAWRLDDDSPLTWTQIGVVGAASGTDNAIVRMDGTTGKVIQNSVVTVSDAGAFTFPDDVRQTFNPGTNNAGLNVGALSGDPSTPSNGDIWYDSTANELTARINGSNVALGAGGGGGGTIGGSSGATDNALIRADGTGGSTIQSSAITLSDAGAFTFPDDVRQTFNPGTNNAGLNVGALSGDPSAPSNGDIWYDSTANELTARINGSNVALGAGGGGGSNLTAPPNAASWTWRNQGGASSNDSSNIFIGCTKVTGVHIVAPSSGSDNLRILEINTPSTPYTITAGFTGLFFADGFYSFGLCWVESGSGKVVEAGYYLTGPQYRVAKWNSVTSFGSGYKTATGPFTSGPVSWIRIADDGVDRFVYFSGDGDEWYLFHQVGRTDFITADKVGWMIDVNNGTNGANVALVHWVQS